MNTHRHVGTEAGDGEITGLGTVAAPAKAEGVLELLRLRGIHDLHGGLTVGEGAFTSELGCVCIPVKLGCFRGCSLSGLKLGFEFLDVLAHMRR